MRKPTHHITVNWMPSGGRYQRCLVVPDVPCPVGEDWMPGMINIPWIQPILVDTVTHGLIAHESEILECENAAQTGSDGYLRFGENGFTHEYASGVLSAYDGTYEYELDNSGSIAEGWEWKGWSLFVGTLDRDGTKHDYLETYVIGSDQTDWRQYPAQIGSEYTESLDGVVRRWLRSSESAIEFDCWNPDGSHASHYSLSYSGVHFNPNESHVVGSYLTNVTRHEVFVSVAHPENSWTRSELTSLWLVPVSPVFVTSALSAQARSARASSVLSSVTRDLKDAWSFTPPMALEKASKEAVDGFRLATVNGIAFVKDIREIVHAAEPLIELLKNPKSLKKWAGFLLSLKYGLRLTWSDFKVLLEAFKHYKRTYKLLQKYAEYRNSTVSKYGTHKEQIGNDRYSGHHRSNVRYVGRLEVPIQATSLGGAIALVQDMGFRLSAENLWDLVPYSFVVEWFINLGDLIEDIDYDHEVNAYRLREAVFSEHNSLKSADNIYLQELDLKGRVSVDCYRRWIAHEFLKPSWGLHPTDAFRDHIVEGALLIIQRSLSD